MSSKVEEKRDTPCHGTNIVQTLSTDFLKKGSGSEVKPDKPKQTTSTVFISFLLNVKKRGCVKIFKIRKQKPINELL